MTNLRLSCAKIIQKILEEKVFFGDLKKQIPEKDLAFCNMLILTVLRRMQALKQILNGFLNKKIPHKHRLAEYLLLCATAEILYMETAQYAVLNESVRTIRQTCDKFLGAMANAILRKVCAQKDELRLQAEKIRVIPNTFLPILEGYTAEQIRGIENSITDIPPLDITVKSDPKIWAEKLAAEILPNGSLRIANPPPIQKLPEYNAGQWWVQDAAATLPVMTMGNIADRKVVDLCAAPGGKTAQLLARNALVTAVDVSEARLNTLAQNMRRLGYNDRLQTIHADALEYMENCATEFDAVLLDAPCSATGTFRRHPEILHLKTKQDVAEQALLQAKMLNSCHKVLKVGGILVYSVCSLAKQEGEAQIENFLSQNHYFKLVKITPEEISPFGTWNEDLILPNGTIRTLPSALQKQKGMDSFFICKMQRII